MAVTRDSKEKTALSEFISKRRQELNLNQLEFSRITGISSGTIASIESGYSQAPKAETLQKLAKGLRVSYQELDCIVRDIPYTPESQEREPLRDFEYYLLQESKLPKEVAETIVEMLRAVLRKYD